MSSNKDAEEKDPDVGKDDVDGAKDSAPEEKALEKLNGDQQYIQPPNI